MQVGIWEFINCNPSERHKIQNRSCNLKELIHTANCVASCKLLLENDLYREFERLPARQQVSCYL
jgi:hypothetical protein